MHVRRYLGNALWITFTRNSSFLRSNSNLVLTEHLPFMRSVLCIRNFLKILLLLKRTATIPKSFWDGWVWNQDNFEWKNEVDDNFLGNIERTIHFKRHIQTLWNEGYIFAILSKKKAEKCLENQGDIIFSFFWYSFDIFFIFFNYLGVGTFLIRFSESQGGLFAIAFCSEDNEEKVFFTYLILFCSSFSFT